MEGLAVVGGEEPRETQEGNGSERQIEGFKWEGETQPDTDLTAMWSDCFIEFDRWGGDKSCT